MGARSSGCGGSSPRGRGGLVAIAVRNHFRGLIPARAGRSVPDLPVCQAAGAHPRAGGAVEQGAREMTPCPGSSPRGRGGQITDDNQADALGLIPARAGRSCGDELSERLLRAHPRAGGAVKPAPDPLTG